MKKLIAIMITLLLFSQAAFSAQQAATLVVDVFAPSDSSYSKKYVYFELNAKRHEQCGGGSMWDPCPVGQYDIVGDQEFHFWVIGSDYNFPVDYSCHITGKIPPNGRRYLAINISDKISCNQWGQTRLIFGVLR